MDEPGGAQMHVRDLSIALKSLGHEVLLLSGSASPVFPELQLHGIHHIHIPHLKRDIRLLQDMKALLALRRAVKQLKPDLVAIHSSKAGLIGRIAGWTLGVPIVFTAHGWAFTEGVPSGKRKLYLLLEKFAGVLSTGIITVSYYDRELAIRHKVASLRKMKVIQNGVPDIGFSGQAQPGKNPVNITMVARFAEPKDHASLLDMLGKLTDRNWMLQLVGDGPLRKEIENKAKTMGLSHRVIFFGNQKDVSTILADTQIFVLISKWEGLPLSILEAMRSGLPVIASNVGGISELIQEGENGFLIERGNLEDLKVKMALLLDRADLREEMGLSGRRHYLNQFTLQRMIRETYEFYHAMISKK
jgi:glycosyltransferase involved in cell wall biosynthesis